MRPPTRTALAGLAAAAVVALAAVGAVRGDGPADAPARSAGPGATATADAPPVDAPLLAPGQEPDDAPPPGLLPGTLLVTAGCRLVEIDLATMARRRLPDACWLSASPGGRYVLMDDARAAPAGGGHRPALVLVDRAAGTRRALPGPCSDVVLPAVDDAGTAYTCAVDGRAAAIAVDGRLRPIPRSQAVLPLRAGALLVDRDRLRALDGVEVIDPPADARLFARAPDGTIGVITGGPGLPARLLTYRDGRRVGEVPVDVGAGVPSTGAFTLLSGGRLAWVPLVVTRAAAIAGPASALDGAAPGLADWPMAVAPGERWVAVAHERELLLMPTDAPGPLAAPYVFRFPVPIGDVAWVT